MELNYSWTNMLFWTETGALSSTEPSLGFDSEVTEDAGTQKKNHQQLQIPNNTARSNGIYEMYRAKKFLCLLLCMDLVRCQLNYLTVIIFEVKGRPYKTQHWWAERRHFTISCNRSGHFSVNIFSWLYCAGTKVLITWLVVHIPMCTAKGKVTGIKQSTTEFSRKQQQIK